MLCRRVVIAGALLSLTIAAEGAPKSNPPEECPVPSSEREKILETLQNAPSCDQAVELFRACSGGASGDVEFGAVVVKNCEGGFLGRLTAQQKKVYDAEQRRCARKYANEQGTMYRSFEAHCGAEVAQKYARRSTGRAAGSPVRRSPTK